MKTRFLLPLAFFLFTSIASAQINKAKHYESILQLTIESFSNSEITKLTTILKLDDNQERTIINLVADYYSELKRIDNDRQAN